DREHRPLLPLEGVRLLLVVGPDFGGAAALRDHHDLFVHMPLGIERAGAWHLDHVAAPLALGAIELNERAVAAHAVPAFERHVLHALHTDAAEDRDALRLHPIVVGRVRALPGAIAGVFSTFRLVPMLAGDFVHGFSPWRACGIGIFPGILALN